MRATDRMHELRWILAASLIAGCSAKAERENYPLRLGDSAVLVRDALHIGTSKLELGKFPDVVELPGRIAIADKDIYVISARAQGRLESVSATVGDKVDRRQPLMTLWSPDLATAVEELKLAVAQNDKELIRLTKEKLVTLGLEPDDLPKNSSTFPIRSPVEGVVLERRLNAGAAVQPGDAILVIGKVDSYQFVGELTPDQALRVKPGMSVLFDDETGLKAEVTSVSPVADPSSRLIRVRCAFLGALPKRLPQETFLKSEVVIAVKDALVAPARSLILTDNGNFVFIRDASLDRDDAQGYRRLSVDLESRNRTFISLKSSKQLRPGMEIVSEGALLLNEIVQR